MLPARVELNVLRRKHLEIDHRENGEPENPDRGLEQRRGRAIGALVANVTDVSSTEAPQGSGPDGDQPQGQGEESHGMQPVYGTEDVHRQIEEHHPGGKAEAQRLGEGQGRSAQAAHEGVAGAHAARAPEQARHPVARVAPEEPFLDWVEPRVEPGESQRGEKQEDRDGPTCAAPRRTLSARSTHRTSPSAELITRTRDGVGRIRLQPAIRAAKPAFEPAGEMGRGGESMKKQVLVRSLIMLSALLVLTSCKKGESSATARRCEHRSGAPSAGWGRTTGTTSLQDRGWHHDEIQHGFHDRDFGNHHGQPLRCRWFRASAFISCPVRPWPPRTA